MPNPIPYTQYNTNAAAVANAEVLRCMGWYEAAVLLYLVAAIVFAGYWFFRNREVLGAGILLAAVGIACQAVSLGLRWYYGAPRALERSVRLTLGGVVLGGALFLDFRRAL